MINAEADPVARFVGNGRTRTFPLPWPVQLPGDVTCTVDSELVACDTEPGPRPAVTVAEAPASGSVIEFRRVMAPTQTRDLVPFEAWEYEAAYDKLVMLMQPLWATLQGKLREMYASGVTRAMVREYVPPAPFSLISPAEGALIDPGPQTFTWEESEGAETYTFLLNHEVVEVGITGTEYQPDISFPSCYEGHWSVVAVTSKGLGRTSRGGHTFATPSPLKADYDASEFGPVLPSSGGFEGLVDDKYIVGAVGGGSTGIAYARVAMLSCVPGEDIAELTIRFEPWGNPGFQQPAGEQVQTRTLSIPEGQFVEIDQSMAAMFSQLRPPSGSTWSWRMLDWSLVKISDDPRTLVKGSVVVVPP